MGDYVGTQVGAALISPANQIQAQVRTTGFVYSRVTRTYVGKVTVNNTSGQDAARPVTVHFAALPDGVALVNPAGTFQGSPYVLVPSADKAGTQLAANQKVTFNLQFVATKAITFIANVYSGSLQ